MGAIPITPSKLSVTPRKFLEEYPLYRKWQVAEWRTPQTLSLDCWYCKKETTWAQDGLDYSSLAAYVLLRYECHLCGHSRISYLIFRSKDEVTKVGQDPAPSSRASRSVEKRLGASTDFYRKALTSQSEGFGLGAVAYFRRVVEDKTNELIDVAAAAAAFGIPDKDVASIRAAKDGKVFDDKLKIAAQAMPDVLKPDGANPLQALHDILSVGIHTQTEEECLQMADEIKDIFEYLFDRLRSEIEDRTSFVTRVKDIVSKRGKRA